MEWVKLEGNWVAVKNLQPTVLCPTELKIPRYIIVVFDYVVGYKRFRPEAINTEKEIKAKTLKFFRDHSYITYTCMFIFCVLENLTTFVRRHIFSI